MSVIKGDFLGFTFDGIHSSELGIFRTSDGSRYTENLLPTIQDKTVQIPGSDGTYYYGSYYTQRPFSFPIAFDGLTEEQLRRIKTLFGQKGVHKLILDEMPYKVYRVKATGTPNLKYVAFDSPKEKIYDRDLFDGADQMYGDLYNLRPRNVNGRIFKGEGQLSFTAYNPFAESRFKYVEDYNLNNIPEWGSLENFNPQDIHGNLHDWLDASRIIRKGTRQKVGEVTYQLDAPDAHGVLVYNAGDLPTHFSLDICFEGTLPAFEIKEASTEEVKISFEPIVLKDGDNGVRINGKLNIIEGIRIEEDKRLGTGNVYNKYHVGGDFFKLDPMFKPELYEFSWTFTAADSQSSDDGSANVETIVDPAQCTYFITYPYLYY